MLCCTPNLILLLISPPSWTSTYSFTSIILIFLHSSSSFLQISHKYLVERVDVANLSIIWMIFFCQYKIHDWFLCKPSPIIALPLSTFVESCQLDLSDFFYGFVKVITCICQVENMYFSPSAKQNQTEVWQRFIFSALHLLARYSADKVFCKT